MTVGRLPNIEGGIQPTLLTTTGDIMYASSASNPARLGIGSSAQVLTVASGVPSWETPASGGMTLLSTTSLAGATTTISGINQTYNSLFIVMFGVTAAGNGDMRCAPNGTTNITTQTGVYSDANSPVTYAQVNTYLQFSSGGWDGTNSNNSIALTINNYTSSSNYKSISNYGYFRNSGGNDGHYVSGGGIETNTAITSLVFSQAGGNLSAGTVLLYGVK